MARAQPGTESLMPTLIVPLNGSLIAHSFVTAQVPSSLALAAANSPSVREPC